MNEDLRNRIVAIFERIDGGSTDDMTNLLDIAIEDGDITKQEFDDNEMAICNIFDDRWFTCVGCNWTMPVDCGSSNDHDEPMCDNCSPDEDD